MYVMDINADKLTLSLGVNSLALLIEHRSISRVQINKAAQFIGERSGSFYTLFVDLLYDSDPIIREGGVFGLREMYYRGFCQEEIRKEIQSLLERETVESVRWVAEGIFE